MKKVVIFIIGLCIFTTGCSIKKVDELTDAEKFSNEFNVSEENPFIYTSVDDVIHILNSGTGIIFLANSDEEASLKAAEILTLAAKEVEIKNIYYYNPKSLKENDLEKYKKLLKIVNEYIEREATNDTLELPDIYSVKDGNIIGHSNYFSKKEQLSEEKLSKKKIEQIKNEYICLLNFEECTN